MNDNFRIETDSLGSIDVPKNRYWGAQTERSLNNFKIGKELQPISLIQAFGFIKYASAKANIKLGKLDKKIGLSILKASIEVYSGKLNEHFPLVVWQTGSGTQTNMNVNEVIANRSIEILGGNIGSKYPVHPNNHVNMSQSSNDCFPTAMNISTIIDTEKLLFPALEKLISALREKERKFGKIIKIGRTHTQDAIPITLGQEFSGYRASLENDFNRLKESLKGVYYLAQGGTAVGTGLNAPLGFDKIFVQQIRKLTNLPFKTAFNKFEALTSHGSLVSFHGNLSALAADLFKISNDIRFLSSGPRSGIGELNLPENEPGSSIMPGKINPTQCEAMTMVACQIFGNQTTVSFASSQGHFELNAYKPVISYNILQSIYLLSDAITSFTKNCIQGISANYKKIKYFLENSLMLATILSPIIGYDQTAKIVKEAHENASSLKEEVLKSGVMTEIDYDNIVQPEKMIFPK